MALPRFTLLAHGPPRSRLSSEKHTQKSPQESVHPSSICFSHKHQTEQQMLVGLYGYRGHARCRSPALTGFPERKRGRRAPGFPLASLTVRRILPLRPAISSDQTLRLYRGGIRVPDRVGRRRDVDLSVLHRVAASRHTVREAARDREDSPRRPARVDPSSRKVTPTWSHFGGELAHEQAGEADRVFRADCKANRGNWRNGHFFSSWAAHARHNAHTLVLQPQDELGWSANSR